MKFGQLIILIVVTFISCEKDRFIGPEIIDESFAEEVTTAQNYYSHIYHIVSSEMELISVEEETTLLPDSLQKSNIDPCAKIIYHMSEDESYVSNLIIQYLDSTCYSSTLKKRGLLNVHFDGPIETVGTEITIIPENFALDNQKVEGTIKIKNRGFNSLFQFEFSQEVLDGRIWLNNFQFFTWNSSSNGFVDFFTNQISYEINAAVLSRTGRAYSVETLYPIKRTLDCRYFQFGEQKLTAAWGLNQNLNYGEGDCDNEAELWQNGSFKEIELP